jgi:uncharacterized membrane protein YbhN (UPF0104 family)
MAAGSASPSSGRWTAIALKFLVSFGVLAAFASVVDGPTLMRLLQEAHPGFIALLLLLVMVRMWIAALRLHLLIAHRASIRINELLRQYFIGAYFNNILPTSIGGDAARIVLLSRSGLSKSEAATYVLIERLLGAAALLVLAVVGSLMFPVAAEVRLAVAGLVALSAVAAAVCLLGWRRVAGLASPDSVSGRAVGAATDLVDRPDRLGLGLLISVAFQLASVSLSYVSALAFGIEISFSACVALVPLVWLVTLLPVSIGGIGLREASFALLLGTVGIGTEESLLISLGTYAALLVSGAVGGILVIRDGTARLFLGRRSDRTRVDPSEAFAEPDDIRSSSKVNGT